MFSRSSNSERSNKKGCLARFQTILTKENYLVALIVMGLTAALYFTPPSLSISTDYVFFYKPNIQFLADSLKEGRLPLWNPYIGLGRPFLADIQNAIFYPPTYLIVVGGNVGLFVFVWLHSLLATFGMRALARAMNMGRIQSYLVTFSFLAGGSMTARLLSGQIYYAASLSYLPVLFLSSIRMAGPWNPRRLGWHAILLALQFLCGHPQVFWFSCISQPVFLFFRSVEFPPTRRWRLPLREVASLTVAMLWCAGLVAVILLPFLELVAQGNRSSSLALANFWKIEFRDLLQLCFQAPNSDWEKDFYMGICMVVPGLLGLFHLRDRNIRGLLAVLVLGLLLSIGDSNPLFQLFFNFLPGFATFRLHSREGMLVAFALLLAAGIWLSKPHPVLRTVLSANLPVPPKYLLVGLAAVQILDLGNHGWRNKTAYSCERAIGYAPEFEYQWTVASVLRASGLMRRSEVPPRVCVPPALIPRNSGMIHGYSSFDAYTSLFLRRPWDYLHVILDVPRPDTLNTSVAQEIYSKGPFPYRDLGLCAGFDFDSGQLVLNTNPVPRAQVVYAVRVLEPPAAILAELKNGHDIRRVSFVEQPLVVRLPENETSIASNASIRQFDCNSFLVDVRAHQDGLLIMPEAWYPGWKAEIGGKKVKALPANGWMRAFPVPAGNREIRVFFEQDYLLVGALITFLSFSLLLVLSTRRYGLKISSSSQ